MTRWSQAFTSQKISPLPWAILLKDYDEPLLQHALRLTDNPHQARQLMARLDEAPEAIRIAPGCLRITLLRILSSDPSGSQRESRSSANEALRFDRDWASHLWSRSVVTLCQESHLLHRPTQESTELSILEKHSLITSDPRLRRAANATSLAQDLALNETMAREKAGRYHQRLLLIFMDEIYQTMEHHCTSTRLKAEFKYLLGLLFSPEGEA